MELEGTVAALVLLAALLHAAWNALTHSSADSLLAIWLITLVAGVIGAAAALWLPIPHREAWPYLLVSAVLHLAYMLFLVRAYRLGDLSRVYPVARGSAPIIVALFAAWVASERPSAIQAAGLLLCSAAIASLAFADAGLRGISARAIGAAFLTGLMIGAYTVVDGSGVRVAGDPFSYVAWNLLLDCIPMTAVVLYMRRGSIATFLRAEALHGLIGGMMAAIAYGIVLWAMSRSAMASIASLRETSVVFAALIGTQLLGEPLGRRRLLAAGVVALGLWIQHL